MYISFRHQWIKLPFVNYRFDGVSPSLHTSTLNRRPPAGGAAASRDLWSGEGRAHCSELDLPSFKADLHRPDSVITTSSIVSSETPSVMGEGLEAPPPPAPPSVYTISGLYGDNVDDDKEEAKKVGGFFLAHIGQNLKPN